MGHIRRRKLQNGQTRYDLSVVVGYEPDSGRPRFSYSTHERRKDAEAEERRLESLRGRGLELQPSQDPLAEYLRGWLRDVKAGQIRERTVEGYAGLIDRYLENPPENVPRLGEVRVDRLTVQAIQRTYRALQDELGLSPATIRLLHTVIRQGLTHAARVGAIAHNPATLVQLPKRQKREVVAMSPGEAARFLEAARSDRYHALWVLLLTGGLRPSEALALKWEDVDFAARKLHIQRSLQRPTGGGWKLAPPKTSNSRRVVILPDFAVEALRGWKKRQAVEKLEAKPDEYADHGLIFTTPEGEPPDQTNLYARNFNEVMRQAELGELGPERKKPRSGPTPRRTFSPKYRMYDLRHSAATLLLRAGEHPKVVSERLGHSSVAFTLDVYSASVPSMQEGAADRMQEMLGGAGG